MHCIFVQIRCKPGKTYDVAHQIAERELHSQLFSVNGNFDLLMQMYIPKDEDIGRYINDKLGDINNIERTESIMTFNAF